MPAGPYSQVETAYGGLSTVVPIVHLKGLGNTSMNVNLQNRSNLIANTSFVATLDSPGAGWSVDNIDAVNINGGTDPVGHNAFIHQIAGDTVEWWDYGITGSSYSNIVPFNGVHQICTLEYSGGTSTSNVVGVVLQDVRSLSKTYYEYHANASVGPYYVFWKSRVVDTFGNTVTYNYGVDPAGHARPASISDASGRTVTFNYAASSPYLLQSIVLNAAGTVRTWSLNNSYFTNGSYYLGNIIFPQVTSGGSTTTPQILLDYWASNLGTNISEIVDLNGNTWTYGYSILNNGSGSLNVPNGVIGNTVFITAVYHPLMTSGGSYNPSAAGTGNVDSSNPTTFAWSTWNDGQYPSISLYACFIGTPSGAWNSAANYRYSAHVYYHGYTDPSNQGVTYAYFVPIFRLVDANVSADGQGGQSVNGPYNGYNENYTWNITDYTVKTMTDRRGHGTTWTYPTSGILANTGLPGSKTDASGDVLQYYYDGSYRLIETVDNVNTSQGGNRVVNTYDATTHALLKNEVNPLSDPYGINAGYGLYGPVSPVDAKKTYTYYSTGTLATEQTGSDAVATYSSYDPYGDAKTMVDPAGNTWQSTYDSFNNKLTETPPAPAGATSMSYDQWDREILVTNPDTSTENFTYDNNSNKTSDLDENGHFTHTFYDQVNRPYSTDEQVDATSGNDILTKAGFDRAADKATLTNGRGYSTTNLFDERHYRTQETYPDATTRKYHYDGDGNNDSYYDGRNYQATHTYDPENRPLVTAYVHDSRTVTDAYNLDGTRSSMVDTKFGSTPSTWIYNGAQLPTAEYQYPVNTTVSYGYQTGSGRKSSMAARSQTWAYNYDSAGRPYTVGQTLGAATAVTFAYNGDDDVSAKTYGSNLWRNRYAYDSRRRITNIYEELFGGSSWTSQNSMNYTLDYMGNVKTCSRQNASSAQVIGTTYGYDYANRLTSEVATNGNGWPSSMAYNNVYAYDKNGNRTSVTRNGLASTYTVDSNDKFTSGDGFTMSNYDGDGNPQTVYNAKTGITMTLVYNQVKEVTQITGLGTTNTFAYDGDGRRVSKTDSKGVTTYAYDGSNVIVEAGSVITYRIPGVGEYNTSSGQLYQMDDQIGSTMGEVAATSSYSGQYNYDGYGLESDFSGPPAQSTAFRFAGKHGYLSDADTGMLLCGARYYLPMLGRFMTQDPIGHTGGLNLYGYCAQNPLKSVDPSGNVQIEVITYRVFGAGWHRGILVIDNMGGHEAYSFSGGPTTYGAGHNGALISRSGPWEGHTQDYWMWHFQPDPAHPLPNDERGAIMLVNDTSSFSQWVNKFKQIEADVAAQPAQDYAPLPAESHLWGGGTANSNTWCHYLLQQTGLLGAYEHAVLKGRQPFAPGWNIKVPYNDAPRN